MIIILTCEVTEWPRSSFRNLVGMPNKGIALYHSKGCMKVSKYLADIVYWCIYSNYFLNVLLTFELFKCVFPSKIPLKICLILKWVQSAAIAFQSDFVIHVGSSFRNSYEDFHGGDLQIKSKVFMEVSSKSILTTLSYTKDFI